MGSVTRTAVKLLLSTVLVLFLAFGSAAKQDSGKGEDIGRAESATSAEGSRDRATQTVSNEEERKWEEKALERMDKARHRDETEREETMPRGLEKQREKKMEQERREQDKGSEQGQGMREERSRKWWKFWD